VSDVTRVLTWQQGDVLTDESVLKLGLCNKAEIGSKLFIVISHDCDLAATADKEPHVEIVDAIPIEKLGVDSHSKNARRLDLEFESNKSQVFLQLLATSKRFVDKDTLLQFSPRDDLNLNGHGLFTLRRWLASRYHRAAFPESFEARLRAAPKAGKKSFLSQIESILEKGGEHIRGVFFDLDEGESAEREEDDDCYSLGIIVLYESSKNEPVAASSAEQIAKELESLFATAFCSKETNKWNGIELQYCDAVSDAVLTVAQQAQLREWRLEHMSLRESPAQVMTS
jgi:hypothetical protein